MIKVVSVILINLFLYLCYVNSCMSRFVCEKVDNLHTGISLLAFGFGLSRRMNVSCSLTLKLFNVSLKSQNEVCTFSVFSL